MATSDKVNIIGIGDDGLEGLTSAARSRIEQAELVIGAEPTLALLPPRAGQQRLAIGGDLDRVVAQLAAEPHRRTAILASGDPLFYGTARYLAGKLGKERFDVTPHVSTMQLAFARVMESWEEAYLGNLATHGIEHVVEKLRTAEKAGLFTTDENPPSRLARALLDRGIDYYSAYVCENLGSPDERVTQGDLAEVAEQEFGPLNVMILIRKPNAPDRPADMIGRRLFGNPDEAFLQSHPKHGLLTPAEVRSIALAELDLGPQSIVWDVGAGSGSVAIEAAQIAREGAVYAIEMDPEDCQMIRTNAQRFGVGNLTVVHGQAPEAWTDLPAPDAVFIGGQGRTVRQLVELAFDRLRQRGRLVATVGSIENLNAVRETLFAKAGDANVWMINIARGAFQLERMRFESLNPTFVLSARRES